MRVDAVYCAVLAVLVIGFAGPVAEQFGGIPRAVLYAAAMATVGWAVSLWLAAREARRTWLVRVVVANSAAAALIGVLALTRPLDAFSLLLLAVGVEVAGFAVVQAAALRARSRTV